ncbi:MAG: transglutaminase domain-containing protein [Syntrophomonas sp.]
MKKTVICFITTMFLFLGIISSYPAIGNAITYSPQSEQPVPIPNPYIEKNGDYRHIIFKSKAVDTDQGQYNAILEALLNLEDEVWVPDYTDSQTTFANMDKVLDDHPEIFYFKAEASQLWSNGRFQLAYKYSKENIGSMQNELTQKVTEILGETVQSGNTSLEKEMGIHDYLISHTRYDSENYDNGTIPDLDYTAYGILVNGTGVCDGYAKSMQLLLTEAGIECMRISGTVSGGGLHAWNLVNLDGEWYHVDATWDDPVPDTCTLRYTYFNQPDSVMNNNHYWESSDYPIAGSSRFTYFNSMSYATHNNEYIYYTDSLDTKLYGIQLDGTGKVCFDVRAIYPTLDGEWIYFSNYSYGGYLYKVKTDGTELTRLNSFWSDEIHRVGRMLYFTNHATGEELSLELAPLYIMVLEPFAPVSVNPGIAFADLPIPSTLTVTLSDGSERSCRISWNSGSDYDPNPAASASYIITGEIILADGVSNPDNLKPSVVVNVTISQPEEIWTDIPPKEKNIDDYWTITFNKEVDPSTVNRDNIFVATDEAGTKPVEYASVAQPDINACQVIVMPADSGWYDADTFYLFISSRVKSKGGQTLKNGIRMKFNVTPYQSAQADTQSWGILLR